MFKTKEPQSDLLIADFGLSRIAEEDKLLQTTCGTPGYMAPGSLDSCRSFGKGRSWETSGFVVNRGHGLFLVLRLT